MSILRVHDRSGDTRDHAIGEAIDIGRASGNAVVLLDPCVSRRHARVERRGGDYVLLDLESAGGIYINGVQVRERVLRHGDRFEVGPWTIVFLADDAPRTVGLGLAALQAKFLAAGLPLPPLPPELSAALQEFGPWWFGTRKTGGLYQYAAPLYDEAGRDDVPDYLIVGYAGHGVNSYALHYFLRHGPLLILLELAYGGAYTNSKLARVEIDAAFAATAGMIAACPELTRRGVPPAGLRVVASSVRPSMWEAGSLGGHGRARPVIEAACAWATGPDPFVA